MTSLGVHMCLLWIIKIASLNFLEHSTIEFKRCKSVNQNYNVFLKVFVQELKGCHFLLSLHFVCPGCFCPFVYLVYVAHLRFWVRCAGMPVCRIHPFPSGGVAGVCISVWETPPGSQKADCNILECRGFLLVSFHLSPVCRQATVKPSVPWPFWSLE